MNFVELIKKSKEITSFYQSKFGVCILDLFNEEEAQEYLIFKNGSTAVVDISHKEMNKAIFGSNFQFNVPFTDHNTVCKLLNILACCTNQINIESNLLKWFFYVNIDGDEDENNDKNSGVTISLGCEFIFHCINECTMPQSEIESLIKSLLIELKNTLRSKILPFSKNIQTFNLENAIDAIFSETKVEVSFDPMLLLAIRKFSQKNSSETNIDERKSRKAIDELEEYVYSYLDYLDEDEADDYTIEEMEKEIVNLIMNMPKEPRIKEQLTEFLSRFNILELYMGYIKAFSYSFDKSEYMLIRRKICELFPLKMFEDILEELDERFNV